MDGSTCEVGKEVEGPKCKSADLRRGSKSLAKPPFSPRAWHLISLPLPFFSTTGRRHGQAGVVVRLCSPSIHQHHHHTTFPQPAPSIQPPLHHPSTSITAPFIHPSLHQCRTSRARSDGCLVLRVSAPLRCRPCCFFSLPPVAAPPSRHFSLAAAASSPTPLLLLFSFPHCCSSLPISLPAATPFLHVSADPFPFLLLLSYLYFLCFSLNRTAAAPSPLNLLLLLRSAASSPTLQLLLLLPLPLPNCCCSSPHPFCCCSSLIFLPLLPCLSPSAARCFPLL